MSNVSKVEKRRAVNNLVRQHETLFMADGTKNVVGKTMAYPVRIGKVWRWFRQLAVKEDRGYSAVIGKALKPKNAKEILSLLA